MKSVADCLDFIDNMVMYNIEKIDSMECLETMRDYFSDDFFKKSDEELVVKKSILSQVNPTINRFFLPEGYSITDYYHDLRERTLAWLKACNKKMENDSQQYTFAIEK